MSLLEAAGAVLGLANLWLTRRQNILCWPVGIACVLCYVLVFHEARLYSDLLLQLIYVVLQAYGWWLWVRGGRNRLVSTAPVRQLRAREWSAWLGLATLIAVMLGSTMSAFTRADQPFWDAGATALSLVAQWLQAHKVLESWLIFIAANLLFIGLYLTKGLYLTAGLFMASSVLAAMGWQTWRAATPNTT